MTRSEAWADLGGGVHVDAEQGPQPTQVPQDATGARLPHVHRFDGLSGWCDCGQRDTGEIYPHTPAAKKAANPAQGAHR